MFDLLMQQKLRKYDMLDSIEFGISLVLKALIGISIILAIIKEDLFLVFTAAFVLFFSFLPAIIEHRFKIFLPTEVDLVMTLFLFLHFFLGEIEQYYLRYWWFDIMLHISSGVLFGLVGFLIAYVFFYTRKIKASPAFIIMFTVSFSLATGVVWEIFEFAADQLFGFNMQKSGLLDTMGDLIVNLIGALIVSIFAFFYMKYARRGFIDRLLSRLLHFNAWKGKK